MEETCVNVRVMPVKFVTRSVLACAAQVLLLFAATAAAQDESGRPARPAPRWPDGTINFGAPPGQTGKWEGQEPLATDPNHYEARTGRGPRPARVHIDDVPLQPWARAIVKMRHDRFLADEPVHALQALARSALDWHGLRGRTAKPAR